MAAFLRDILTPVTLTKVVSQTAADDELLLEFFGMQPGGSNELYVGHGRVGNFHVFNQTRVPAKGRGPGLAAARSSLQNVGRVTFEYPRMHDSLQVPMEVFSNIGKIDDPTQRDRAALDMIGKQTSYLGRRARNWRIALLVGMLRGSCYLAGDGDTTYINYSTGTQLTVGAMPSGNKAQLNINGDGNIIKTSWNNPAADIPLMVGNINAGFQQLHGFPVAAAICNYKTFNYITSNDAVIQKAGFSNAPFQRFDLEVGTGPDGRPLLAYYASFNWCPGIKWFVTDAGLNIGAPGSETFTKHIPDDYVVFTTDPKNTDVFAGYLGSEPIAEYDNGPTDLKVGMASWSTTTANPTAVNLFALDNFLPVNHVPGTIAYAQVVF